MTTVGMDVAFFTKSFGNDEVKFHVYDTCGREWYRSSYIFHMKSVHAAVVFFDISKKSTLKQAKEYIKILHEHAANIPIFLDGNKCDLKWDVTKEYIKLLSQNLKIQRFFITSAKDNTGIQNMFESIIDILYKPKKQYKILLVGQDKPGKTSILRRYKENIFDPNEKPTTNNNDVLLNIPMEQESIELQCHDTIGNGFNWPLIGINAAIIFFDVSKNHHLNKQKKIITNYKKLILIFQYF